ncbi:(2Fe-2S) ferredoxin domain-containing protein [Streptosporangium sp. NPDC001681]|uniref:(2Fe-2S) ferredoxin domain-containing protein n=1 Tax=Streptosporangium sp. NPDC001681 TaxID=3154395 RepID=UPI003331EC89
MSRLTVCRDCCCGSTRKIPALDHDEQLRRLSEIADVHVSDCLDVCEQANVIVVRPSPAGRAAGGRPVWLGLVNHLDVAEDIAAWIQAGGPGLAPIPDILTLHLFTRTRS